MDPEILRQVWPVFAAEAREHLEAIGAGVLALERSADQPEIFESLQRAAHSLKGSAASLGLEAVERVAHAVEGALVTALAAGAFPPSTVQAVLRAVAAVEAALDAGGGAEALRIEGVPALLAALRSEDHPAPAPRATSGDGTPAPAPERGSTPAAPQEERSIRVAAGKLDSVARHIESLVLGEGRGERRARELQAVERALRDGLRAASAAGAGGPQGLGKLVIQAQELGRLAREAQHEAARSRLQAAAIREDLRDLRMVPSALALEPLRRTAREAAGRLGKQIQLDLTGGDIRLDRRILDGLREPLVHLVRNAVDHGIEPPAERAAAGKPAAGRVVVRVEPRGQRVGVVVSDDGAGLSPERIRTAAVARGLLSADEAKRLGEPETLRLVFAPSFSTTSEVTAISGRGVGLDVVQDAVTRLQGVVQVSSVPGRGATFDLDVPLSLAATVGVLCSVGGELAVVPTEAIERVLRLGAEDLGTVAGEVSARVGTAQLPYAELARVLGIPERPPAAGEKRPALVLALGSRRVVLAVDGVLGERELVVSSLGRRAAGVGHLAGVATLDDGLLVAVLNPAEILRRAGPETRGARAQERARIVVADDAITTRSAMKAILEIAGYVVLPAADGQEAWELVAEGRVQLVVTDVQMPRLDGLALTRRIKADARLAHIPVVLITSLDAPEDRMIGLEAGADGYLVKREVETGKLLELVRLHLPGPA